MRKLASVQRIKNIEPIEGADLIVKAQVLGWDMITKKGEFSIGDLCVFFEIDSFLRASDERFAFLMKRSSRMYNGYEGHKLRSVKMKGVLAQGLALPISLFPEIVDPVEDMDVTELLNVEKWEPPIHPSLAGRVAGMFPSWIRKTDQDRVQGIRNFEERVTGVTFEKTIKLDGSSLTAFYYKDRPDFDEEKERLEMGVCSRNMEIKLSNTENSFVQMFYTKNMGEILKRFYEQFGTNLAIQGELFGEGIQGNLENIKGLDFRIFDIFNIDKQEYLLPKERHDVIAIMNGFGLGVLESTKVLDHDCDINKNYSDIKAILKDAEGPTMFCDNDREGIVFKANARDKMGNIFSFKAISNLYLLQHDDR